MMLFWKSSDPIKRMKADIAEAGHLMLDKEREAENHQFAAEVAQAQARLYATRIQKLESRLKSLEATTNTASSGAEKHPPSRPLGVVSQSVGHPHHISMGGGVSA